jgi:glycosyltransferase involved in cell wall biosynthesis
VSELGLAGKVIFAGSRKNVPEILSILDIFVLPSLKEGLPMALLEAMASHVPVVATNVGAVPAVIEDGVTGILISPMDSAVIARAISQLLSDKRAALQMAEKGFNSVRDNFSSQKMASQYFAVYKELMDGAECWE